MKIIGMLISLSFFCFAQEPEYQWISIGTDAVESLNQKSFPEAKLFAGNQMASVMRVKKNQIKAISHLMHEKYERCAGFMAHKTEEEALEAASFNSEKNRAGSAIFANYSIDMASTVEPMIQEVKETNIRNTIIKLSNFENRYYLNQTGVESQNWVKDLWSKYLAARSDAKVEFFQHKNWPQPSVVATIQGEQIPNEVIVIGGHADSINRRSSRAPGADDNASGIATISEVIRVLAETGYRPSRTIKFIGYAAEEVGLLGSQEIAKDFKLNNKEVIGVMQLDMTNHKGTHDKDIVMMTDFTNKPQNQFLGQVIDTYLKIPWGYSQCGYGCSDHASWYRQGYPASMPFESKMEDINHKIHTNQDTIDASGGTAEHATKFAKMATAYMVELAK